MISGDCCIVSFEPLYLYLQMFQTVIDGISIEVNIVTHIELCLSFLRFPVTGRLWRNAQCIRTLFRGIRWHTQFHVFPAVCTLFTGNSASCDSILAIELELRIFV